MNIFLDSLHCCWKSKIGLNQFGWGRKLTKRKNMPFPFKKNRKRTWRKIGGEITRNKITWAHDCWSLQFSGFYKIGLANFGTTKNVGHFWNSNHIELWPPFLEVAKMKQGIENPWEWEWIGYAKFGVKGSTIANGKNPPTSFLNQLGWIQRQFKWAPIAMQN